jgi:hypothetical protein
VVVESLVRGGSRQYILALRRIDVGGAVFLGSRWSILRSSVGLIDLACVKKNQIKQNRDVLAVTCRDDELGLQKYHQSKEEELQCAMKKKSDVRLKSSKQYSKAMNGVRIP